MVVVVGRVLQHRKVAAVAVAVLVLVLDGMMPLHHTIMIILVLAAEDLDIQVPMRMLSQILQNEGMVLEEFL